ncbi:4'-phosphopantetheinyl transferase family protein [Bacillus chungangensis]|uniref:4'-phosphopantetheinyl transferase n=1 Tax=Bacillus chungangensis TaxID=587633 RepID=A0ABT9WV05_9BACI|nr:4'-phosphopantetheinyl transferase superfamily protein [Bacillus chungangensis]MDQ0176610.1 4'-phosphopantetheinyl transferase [Bacillus chungangensis]
MSISFLKQKIQPETCHIWYADVTDEHDLFRHLISSEENERYVSFRRSKDRDRALVSYSLVRLVLAHYTDLQPYELNIIRTCPQCGKSHGKPRLVMHPDDHLQFNVSHSGNIVIMAVTVENPVGIDVEQIDPRLSAEELIKKVLSPSERQVLFQLPKEERVQHFYTYWTRKEAILKATGQGLTIPLEHVTVSCPTERAELLMWANEQERVDRFTMHDLHLWEDYKACLAVIGTCKKVEVKNGSALLADWRHSDKTLRQSGYLS